MRFYGLYVLYFDEPLCHICILIWMPYLSSTMLLETNCMYLFLCVGRIFIMEALQSKCRNVIWDNSSIWIDWEVLGTAFVFAVYTLPSWTWEFLKIMGDFPEENKRIWNEYDRCVIPLLKCLLCLIYFCLPFNDFEINVLNHLLIVPS